MFFFRLFTLRSARVSALVIALSECSCERIRKLETCTILKEEIVGARLAGASVTKTATLLGVLRATVSKVLSAYANHRETTSAKRNSGRQSTLGERDCRTLRRVVSKNHRTTAAQVTAELNIFLEDLISIKTVRSELQRSNIHGGAATAKPLNS
jgi:transposase